MFLEQARPHFLAKFKATRNKLGQKRHRYSVPKTFCVLQYIIKYRYKFKLKDLFSKSYHSRKELLEREKAKTSQPRLAFNITYYPVFQNIRNILQELHLLLAPDREHKKAFLDVPVVGFRNAKSLKDYLVRAALPKANEIRRCEPCGKKTCLVCKSIRTTTALYSRSMWRSF